MSHDPGNRRRGRRLAILITLLGLSVLAAGAFVFFKGLAAEWWWIRRLESPDAKVRSEAIDVLAARRSAWAIPRLVRLAAPAGPETPEEKVSGEPALLKALLRIGPRAIAALLKHLEKEELQIRMAYRFRETVTEHEPFIGLLKSQDHNLRLFAIRALGYSPFHETIQAALAEALEDPNWRVQCAAACELAIALPPRRPLREALRRGLKEGSPAARLKVLQALKRAGVNARFAVSDLIEALREGYPEAAAALGKIGREPAAAIPALLGALKEKDPALREAAAQALARFGAAAVPPLAGALEGGDDLVQFEALEILGNLGPLAEPALPAIEKFLPSGDEDLSRQANWAAATVRGMEPRAH
ncbi:MAG: HEAT repeat domain-containing protein [Planctomycetes bacterium]|nr:HEAT repeat domain-containing protein [Planctomycetota bacterium]